MPPYEFYHVDDASRIIWRREQDCPDDGAAIQRARDMLTTDSNTPAIEVWQSNRRVAVVRRKRD